VLDGNLNVTQTTEVANEILNDMQRSRGGDVVQEDESRYSVELRRTDGKGDWAGEVAGPPSFFSLATVNVLSAGKMIYVFDQHNKLLWKSELSYRLDDTAVVAGDGPCVEHKNSLYVFDSGVLSAFDLRTGQVRWRLPSVGICGLFFGDEDMLYVNTTTAGLEK